MEEEGLAQMMSSGRVAGGGQATMEDVGQVIQLLQSGKSPEELLALGVPEAIIMQAIQMLQQEQASMQGRGRGMQGADQGLGGMLAAR